MPASRARPGELLTERAGFSVFQGLELETQTSASELALRALDPVGFSSDSASPWSVVYTDKKGWATPRLAMDGARTFGPGRAISGIGVRKGRPDIFVRIQVGAGEARAHGLLGLFGRSRGHGKAGIDPQPRLERREKKER